MKSGLRGSGGKIASSRPSGMSLSKPAAKEQRPTVCSSRASVSDSDTEESLPDLSQMELFACARCYVRRKFDDLSEKDMFCKECLDTQLFLKCAYCQCEFRQHFELTSTICVQCQQNERVFGKPITCEHCNLIAAFGGSKCDCLKKIAKYGKPMPCSKCKLVAAFKRFDIPQPAGRLFNRNKKPKEPKPAGLCWLCVQPEPPLLPASPILRSTLATIKTEIVTPSPPRTPIPERLPKRGTCENNLMAPESKIAKTRKRPRPMDEAFTNDALAQNEFSNMTETNSGHVSTFSPPKTLQHIPIQTSSLAHESKMAKTRKRPRPMDDAFANNAFAQNEFSNKTETNSGRVSTFSPPKLQQHIPIQTSSLAPESKMVKTRKRPRPLDDVFANNAFAQNEFSNKTETNSDRVSTFSPPKLQQNIPIQTSSQAPTTLTMNSSFESNLLADDQLVTVTLLKEEIHSLNRKIKAKDQEFIKMQVQITELKGELDREQRDSSRKSHELQRQHSNKMEKLQNNLNKMTKVIADLKKTQTTNKKQPSTSKASVPKASIASGAKKPKKDDKTE